MIRAGYVFSFRDHQGHLTRARTYIRGRIIHTNKPHPGQETPLACSEVSPIQRHGGFVPQFSPSLWYFHPSLACPLYGTSTPLSGTITPLPGTSSPLSGTSSPLSGTSTPLWYFHPALCLVLSPPLCLVLQPRSLVLPPLSLVLQPSLSRTRTTLFLLSCYFTY